MGDQFLVLDRGRIAQASPSASFTAIPHLRRWARFLNCYNVLTGRPENGVFHTAAGRLPLGSHLRPAAEAAYAIRYDRIDVRPSGHPLPRMRPASRAPSSPPNIRALPSIPSSISMTARFRGRGAFSGNS